MFRSITRIVSNEGPPRSFLLVDTSGSMSQTDLQPSRLEAAKDAACEYIRELCNARPETLVTVIGYSNKTDIQCKNGDMREGPRHVWEAVRRLRGGGTTHMGKALKAVQHNLSLTLYAGPVHVVLLSDGYHNGRFNPVKIADSIKKRYSARIDCVGVGSDHLSVDELLLRKIASLDENGRPRYHFIKDGVQLVEHFRRLAGFLSRE